MTRGNDNKTANTAREHLLALTGYVVLSIAVTWPTALHFTTEGLGTFYLDRVQNLWNGWWVKTALLDRHTNPFSTDLLLYPQGADLYFHTLNLPGTLLALPVQVLAGPVAGYNFGMLLALVLSGYAGYRLVRYLTGHAGAAFVGGIIYGFSPLVLFQLRGHTQIISLQWLALCIEFYLRAWNGRQRRDALLAGVFFALALLTVGYFEVFLAIFFVLHLGWALLTRPGRLPDRLRDLARRAGPPAGWAGASALLISGPYLLGALLSLGKGQVIIPDVTDVPHTLAESADLLSFIVPNRDHWLLGGQMPWWSGINPAIHDRTYLGVVVVALAAFGAWTRRRAAATWLWVAVAAVGVVLALGPVLQFNYQALGPAPLALLADVPPFNLVRGPERFATLAYLGLAVLASWGILDFGFWILDFRSRKRVQNAAVTPSDTSNPKSKIQNPKWLIPAIIALLLLDLPLHVYYTEAMPVPAALAALGRDPAPGALLELPFTQHGWIDAPRMLYQTGHGRPITSGYLSRHVVDPYPQACSWLQAFAAYPRSPAADIVAPTGTDQLPVLLREAGVGFIAIYKIGFVQAERMTPLPAQQFAQYTALAAPLADPAYEDEVAKVYRVRPTTAPLHPFLQLGPDWHAVEQSNDQPFRWINGARADLCVFSPTAQTAPLTFQVTSFAAPRRLQVWVDDRQVFETPVPADGTLHAITTPALAWPAGPQRVRLVVPEGSASPAALGQGSDQRQISLGFGPIRLGNP